MPKRRVLDPPSVWEEALVRAAFREAGVKESHIHRLYKHLTRDPHVPYESIPDLPKAACHLLQRDFVRFTSTVDQCQTSSDGTKKLLIRLQDGLQIESVVMVYDTTSYWRGDETRAEQETGRVRSTLCISSQVGCQMGCTFCATGTMGLVADLTAAEILEQAVHAMQHSPIRNIVFMGMLACRVSYGANQPSQAISWTGDFVYVKSGEDRAFAAQGEPLNNYGAVRAAVQLLVDGRVFGLRRQKVTVSTVGIIPRVLQLAEDLPGVSLAVSLHAPNQALRQSIVPSAKAYPLPKLMQALDAFLDKAGQKDAKIFLEYVMLSGVNDGAKEAHQLGALLSHRPAQYMVNLIPWNPVYSPGIDFRAPDAHRLSEFHGIVRSHGLLCTVRREMGQEISGACGQLVLENPTPQGKRCGAQEQDIEEIGSGSAIPSASQPAKRKSLWSLFGTVS